MSSENISLREEDVIEKKNTTGKGASDHRSTRQPRLGGQFTRTKSRTKKRHPGLGRPCPQCQRSKPYTDVTALKHHLKFSCPKGKVNDEERIGQLCEQSKGMAKLYNIEKLNRQSWSSQSAIVEALPKGNGNSNSVVINMNHGELANINGNGSQFVSISPTGSPPVSSKSLDIESALEKWSSSF